MGYAPPGSGIGNGRDERRQAWLARNERDQRHHRHSSHVEGHKRPPDQPDDTDTGESTPNPVTAHPRPVNPDNTPHTSGNT